MTSVFTKRRVLGVVGGAAAVALALTGCAGSGGGDNSGGSSGIIVGTTDKVTSIDPAGSYDNGSFAIMNQVYPFLLNSKPGSSDVVPDIAASAEFTDPTTYTVKLKPGLKFANGDDLTSSDVKFSFDRQTKIAFDNGPSYLLGNIASTDAPDPTTVVFHLKNGNDQTFAQVLSGPAGPIVDEQVFSPDKVTSDDDIVKGDAFAGPYTITSYKFNELVKFKANKDYQGVLGAAKTSDVTLKYYASSSNLKLDVQEGNIDVAYRTLTPTDIADLKTKDSVKIVDGPGGFIDYIVFNFNTMPYGAKTSTPDAAKSLAVRKAMADLVDRKAITSQVFKDTSQPLYSYVAAGFPGATTVLKDLYGDGQGGPDADKAKQTLADAGVTVPVSINLQYNTDHYGEASADEYALVKSQLETSGLFKVNLQSTEYVQYSKDRTADVYPAYQLGWFPDFSDPDNYLTPFFAADNFLVNHYSDPEVSKLLTSEATDPNPDTRKATIEQIQAKVAAQLSTLPLTQQSQTVVVGSDVSGAVLDPSFKFRFGTLSK